MDIATASRYLARMLRTLMILVSVMALAVVSLAASAHETGMAMARDTAAPMQHMDPHLDHAAMSKAPACAADSICADEPGLCELVCMGAGAMLWPAPAPSGVTAPQKSYRRHPGEVLVATAPGPGDRPPIPRLP
ncbi:hypothetical protein [Kaistia adipata]|uniref:hypothetical protein n=1 Tax=Kaistia adipata TaxID=166954 RepID=UPI0012EC2886|nr:hypothetical protein [Kaistia adipata]